MIFSIREQFYIKIKKALEVVKSLLVQLQEDKRIQVG